MTFNFSSDLVCYSLSMNNNVPTSTLDMNHYYSYRQQSQAPADSPPPQGPAPAQQQQQQQQQQSAHASPPPSFTKKPSKLDVLIQTATSVDLDSFLPSTISLNEKKRKLSSSFSLEYLCNQAEKELNSSSASSSSSLSSSSSSVSSSSVPLMKNQNGNENDPQFKRANKKANRKNSGVAKSSKAPSPVSAKPALLGPNQQQQQQASPYPSAANPLAIKLASPSTHTKRQRSGPSCDCCRSRKIKCDSEIFILSALDSINLSENVKPKSINSHIAHCDFISVNPKSGYQYYKIIKDEEHALNNKLTSFNYLQFKPCSACMSKKLKCCFSKGFTRNDIIKFNKTEKMNGSSTTNLSSTFSSTTPTADSSVLPSPSTSIPASPPSSSSSASAQANAFPSSQTSSFNSHLPDPASFPASHIHVKVESHNHTASSASNALKSVSSSLPTPSPTPAVLNNTISSAANPAAAAVTSSSSSSLLHSSPAITSVSEVVVSNGLAAERAPFYASRLPESSALETMKHESQSQYQSQFGKIKDVMKSSRPKDIKDREREKDKERDRKSSKKTSCKTCRFKKIKCVKVDGSDRCVYCNKKSICCLFE